jgi:hypothetical protein
MSVYPILILGEIDEMATTSIFGSQKSQHQFLLVFSVCAFVGLNMHHYSKKGW